MDGMGRSEHSKEHEAVVEVEGYSYVVSAYFLKDAEKSVSDHASRLVKERAIRTIARREASQ